VRVLDCPKETVMTDLAASDRQVFLATPALPRRAANDRGVFISLLLLCCTTMVSWLALLIWGSGYILGIW
jgi:hypothetical protein